MKSAAIKPESANRITAKTICKQLPDVNGLDAIKVLDQLVSENLIKRVDRNYFKK